MCLPGATYHNKHTITQTNKHNDRTVPFYSSDSKSNSSKEEEEEEKEEEKEEEQ